MLAPQILAELRPPSELQEFTRNTAVVGAYVEAAVRELIQRHVFPLRVASGAVIDQKNTPGDPSLPQIDTIIWAPSPVPAVFQVGDFALVPRSSAFGVLEIKSSAYDPCKLDKRLESGFIQKVTADPLSEEEKQVVDKYGSGLGVICVLKKGQGQESLAKMKNTDRVVALFEERDEVVQPRPRDIYRLVNFLNAVRLRRRWHEGQVEINLELLNE